MKKHISFNDLLMFVAMMFVVYMLLCFGTIFSSCSNNQPQEIIKLQKELEKKNELIKAYERFRFVALQIYVSEVDNTGDTYDSSDKGVEFWHSNNRIDSIANSMIEVK